MGADFVQNAALIAVAIVTALIGVLKYVKTQDGKSPDKQPTDMGSVVAASFIDSRVLRELIDTLKLHIEEYARETKKMNRNRQELSSVLEENTDSTLSNTDAMLNMLRFMKREQREVNEE